MKKLLKIRFVKFERALVAQQLEIQWGYTSFESFEHTMFDAFHIDFAYDAIWIGRHPNGNVAVRVFESNAARDEYFQKAIKWISEEQFAAKGELKIGTMCEVSDNKEDWVKRTLLAVLPKNYSNRYIAQVGDSKNKWTYWKYVRLIDSFVRPKIDGDVYTWEMEMK